MEHCSIQQYRNRGSIIRLWIMLCYLGYPDIFCFLLSVSARLKKTKKINNQMFGALGNTWRYNFCMGMQSSMRLEKWWFQIFDSHLYIKDMPLECLPYFCTGKPYVCAFAMIYTSIDASSNVCIGKSYLLKVLCREPAWKIQSIK